MKTRKYAVPAGKGLNSEKNIAHSRLINTQSTSMTFILRWYNVVYPVISCVEFQAVNIIHRTIHTKWLRWFRHFEYLSNMVDLHYYAKTKNSICSPVK